jgi:hypothetical protein
MPAHVSGREGINGSDAVLSPGNAIKSAMSYTVTLWCGCRVYVACHPVTRLAHSRVIELRDSKCPVRHHDVGARLWLWELLPDPRTAQATPAFEDVTDR